MRLLPSWQAFVAISGDDWHLHLVNRGKHHQVIHADIPNAANATLHDLIRQLKAIKKREVRRLSEDEDIRAVGQPANPIEKSPASD